MPDETELSGERDGFADEDDEIKQTADDAAGRFSEALRQQRDATIQALQQAQQAIAAATFEAEARDEAWSEPISDIREGFGETDMPIQRELGLAEDAAQKLLDNIATADENNSQRTRNLRRFLAAMCGVATPGDPALVYELAVRYGSGVGVADIPAPDAVKDQVRTLVERLSGVTDDAYFDALVQYASKNPDLTLADMAMFMQYTQQLFPLQSPYLWMSDSNKLNNMRMLSRQLGTGSTGGALGLMRHMNENPADASTPVLPRALVASCASMAFATMAQSLAADASAGDANADPNDESDSDN